MLTDAAIRRLSPRDNAYRTFCPSVPGFAVKVLPSGAKTFELRHKSRYYRLGTVGLTPLSAAREKARAILARLDQGLPATESPPATATLDTMLSAWSAHQQASGRRRVEKTERMIRANLTPALLDRPANSITATDLRAILSACHRRGARVLSNRLRAYLHAIFQYGLKADHDPARFDDPALFGIEVNPVAAIPRDAGAEHPGERSLTWHEVRLLWWAEESIMSWIGRQGVRLLLLTGQRVNEVVQAAWSEFDLDAGLWTLPAGRSKGRRDHIVPLSPLAVSLLRELVDLYPGDYLFPARNAVGATAPWGPTAMGHVVHDAAIRLEMPRVQARDLRRTWKTLAGEAGLSLEIRNRIQGHALQDVGSRHYDRHGYLEEKRAAMDRWERVLLGRLNEGGNVVALKPSLATHP